jgi:hypothetical protein
LHHINAGIIENEALLGVAIKPQSILSKALSFRKSSPKNTPAAETITIITEEEAGGCRATEMFKLEAEYCRNKDKDEEEEEEDKDKEEDNRKDKEEDKDKEEEKEDRALGHISSEVSGDGGSSGSCDESENTRSEEIGTRIPDR